MRLEEEDELVENVDEGRVDEFELAADNATSASEE